VKRFRGGLVFKDYRLVYHSSLGSRGIQRKKGKPSTLDMSPPIWCRTEQTGGQTGVQPGIVWRVRQRRTRHIVDVTHQLDLLPEVHLRALPRLFPGARRRRAARGGGGCGDKRVLADEDLVKDNADRPDVRAGTCGKCRSPPEAQKGTIGAAGALLKIVRQPKMFLCPIILRCWCVRLLSWLYDVYQGWSRSSPDSGRNVPSPPETTTCRKKQFVKY